MTPDSASFRQLTGGSRLGVRPRLLFAVAARPPGTTDPPMQYHLTWDTTPGPVRRPGSVGRCRPDSSWAVALLR